MASWIDLKEIYISNDETHHIYRGKPLYKKRFLKVLSFHDPGVAAVMDETGWYHIDLKGSPIYKRRFLRAFGFYEGLAAVVDETGWYHINLKGEHAYAQRFAWVGNFQEGRAPVRDFDGMYFHIDKSGRPVYKERYRYVGDFKYGIAVVYCDEGYARYIDRHGRYVSDKKYIELYPYHKGFAIARDERGYFHIDKNGDPIYSERYEWVEPFYNGCALVKTKDGKMGIINERGMWIHTVCDKQKNSEALLREVMNDLVAFWRSQILYAGSKLGIYAYMYAKNRVTLEELSCELNINPDGLRRLLDALIILGYIRRKNKYYTLSTKGKVMWEKLRYASLLWGDEHYLAFSGLWFSVKTGKSYFEKIYGKNFFEYISENPEKLKIYHEALREYASIDYKLIPEVIDFSIHKTLMDVGGGIGELLKFILQKYNIEVILFERPEVIDYINSNLSDSFYKKIKMIKGDFLQYIPSVAEAIVMSRVLHDWPDDKAQIILANAYKALPKDGRLYIVEIIKPEKPKNDLGVMLDLNMLCVTGGKERTRKDFESLLKKASFEIEEIITINILSVIIAKKTKE